MSSILEDEPERYDGAAGSGGRPYMTKRGLSIVANTEATTAAAAMAMVAATPCLAAADATGGAVGVAVDGASVGVAVVGDAVVGGAVGVCTHTDRLCGAGERRAWQSS